MSISEFFAYLLRDERSHDLAVELVDAYRARHGRRDGRHRLLTLRPGRDPGESGGKASKSGSIAPSGRSMILPSRTARPHRRGLRTGGQAMRARVVIVAVVATLTVGLLSNAAGARTRNPCKVLKASEIESTLGGTVGSPAKGLTTAVSTQCKWSVAASVERPKGDVIVHYMFKGGPAVYVVLRSNAAYEPVEGLGKALYSERTGALGVLKGGLYLTVQGVFIDAFEPARPPGRRGATARRSDEGGPEAGLTSCLGDRDEDRELRPLAVPDGARRACRRTRRPPRPRPARGTGSRTPTAAARRRRRGRVPNRGTHPHRAPRPRRTTRR